MVEDQECHSPSSGHPEVSWYHCRSWWQPRAKPIFPTANVQVVAASDLVDALCEILTEGPTNSTVQIAGPDRAPMNEVVSRNLKAKGDDRSSEQTGTRFILDLVWRLILLSGRQCADLPDNFKMNSLLGVSDNAQLHEFIVLSSK